MPDDDPKKAELKSEIDGLTAENTTLQAETAELNTIEGQAITMTDLSNLMTNLSDVAAAIGTLNEGIAAQQAVISEQVAVADNIQSEVDTESKSVASAKSKTESLSTEIEKKGGDNDDTANEGITVAQGIQIGAGIGQGVSTAVKTVGEALVASGYGVAAGTVMVTAGKYGEIGFGLIGEGASIYETATNEDLSDSERALAIGKSIVGALGTVANLTTEIISDVTSDKSDLDNLADKYLNSGDSETSGQRYEKMGQS